MIFAAGLGTRLKPLTDNMPKAMVPVSGRPLIEHLIVKMKKAGFDDIIINVHHFSDQIVNFVKENNSFGIRIEFSYEKDQLLETGGGLRKAQAFFDDKPFLVHNVDIISNLDLREFYDSHKREALATLSVSERNTSRYLLFDECSRLKGWINKKSGETKPADLDLRTGLRELAFSGIQIVSPEIFKYMNEFPDRFSIIDLYLDVMKEHLVSGYVADDFRIMDVGKIESVNMAEDFIQTLK